VRRMKRLLLALGLLAACGDEDEGGVFGRDLVAHLNDGDVQGERSGESVRFLKIPYAAPPVGDLRWKAPQPAPAWSGVRKETQFASPCPQLANSQGPTSANEDCLYLNVWAPSPAPEKAPVMVWIHGGGNFAGSAGDKVPTQIAMEQAPLFYDGQFFAARQGVVLVSLNYRLGPFGFFAHPALGAEGSPQGNQGLLDQNAALQWVRDNIEAFGGDPANVTIFGESAGSADVCYHVVSPLGAGLFQRAISQSGGCTTGPSGDRDSTATEAAKGVLAYEKAVGCDGLACLRGKSVEQLLAQSMQPNPSGGFFDTPMWRFAPVTGTPFLPEAPVQAFARGTVNRVPYLLGSNTDEGTLFTFTTPVTSAEAYTQRLRQGYGELAPQLEALYPASKFNNDYTAAMARVIGDSGLVCGTHDTARLAAQAGLPVFMYNFNVPWTVGFGLLGAAHGAEISHVFGAPYMPTPDQERVSSAMNTYWATFAKTGDPNFAGAPALWPAFGDDRRLQLDTAFSTLQGFRGEECTFWRGVYAMRRASAAP
ncbi:MAG: carboxylesterase/lipase family protein, partial [Polyangiales bacterium]